MILWFSENIRDQNLLQLIAANTFLSTVYLCLNKWTWWRRTEWGSGVSGHWIREESCDVLEDLKHNYYFNCILVSFQLKIYVTTWSVWRNSEASLLFCLLACLFSCLLPPFLLSSFPHFLFFSLPSLPSNKLLDFLNVRCKTLSNISFTLGILQGKGE